MGLQLELISKDLSSAHREINIRAVQLKDKDKECAVLKDKLHRANDTIKQLHDELGKQSEQSLAPSNDTDNDVCKDCLTSSNKLSQSQTILDQTSVRLQCLQAEHKKLSNECSEMEVQWSVLKDRCLKYQEDVNQLQSINIGLVMDHEQSKKKIQLLQDEVTCWKVKFEDISAHTHETSRPEGQAWVKQHTQNNPADKTEQSFQVKLSNQFECLTEGDKSGTPSPAISDTCAITDKISALRKKHQYWYPKSRKQIK